MKILRLEAENFKRLKAVDITPTGNLVPITGKNANGKSSVLDAIWAALGGATHLQAEPIRKGATKARIKLDLGELVVTRNITEKGSTLTVENAEGLSYKAPQRMLDDLVGALAFDPLAFTRMKPREQYDQLRTVAQVELDLDKLDALNKADFEKRADLNREAKQLRAQIEGITVSEVVPPTVDVEALLAEQQHINQANTQARLAHQERTRKEQELARLKEDIETVRARFASLKGQIDALTLELECELVVDQSDFEARMQEITGRIRDAQAQTEAAALARQQAARVSDLEARAEGTEAKAQALTETMATRNKVKMDAIAAAKIPVPGLSFGEGVVLFNGVPFDQASSAEQLRVSVSIAMAANPALRVIRITDGSLLDEDSMAMLGEMAREGDYQVWVEVVDSTGKVGVVIHDGEVVADNQQPACEVASTVPGLE